MADGKTATDGMIEQRDLNLAFLISNKGTGSNLQAGIDAIADGKLNANIKLVVSDQPDALGLERARRYKIPTYVHRRQDFATRNEYGLFLADLLNDNDVNISVLAGFATILPPSYFQIFRGLTINIHPGLVPDHDNEPVIFPDGTIAPWNKGMLTDQAVKNFLGMKYAGSTWHIATEQADFGPVLQRVIVDVSPDDTVESLYGRLKVQEHAALIDVLNTFSVK